MNKNNLYFFNWFVLITGCLLFSIACSTAQKPLANTSEMTQRKMENINNDWQYLEENHTAIEPVKAATAWTKINLPHTWNQWDATDLVPGYRRNASWYKKELVIPAQEDAQYLLYFEAVNLQAHVYVNGQLAGKHIGGYVGFEIDITEFVKKGQSNEILVRADNGYNRDVIPSQKADFSSDLSRS